MVNASFISKLLLAPLLFFYFYFSMYVDRPWCMRTWLYHELLANKRFYRVYGADFSTFHITIAVVAGISSSMLRTLAG